MDNNTLVHLGSLEGSVTSSAFIDYYERALQLHTHFIIKKDLVYEKTKSLIPSYTQGNGLEDFLRLKKSSC
ncbi:MAG: hypothetical protein U9R39_03690 [Campylobacterota bacterium]|nr:hypothetical protein [Campylobacterota bacterium]